jgi:hypothetical protein
MVLHSSRIYYLITSGIEKVAALRVASYERLVVVGKFNSIFVLFLFFCKFP